MSISTEKPKSPCVRYFEWNGNAEHGGTFKYYDKAQQKEVSVKPPFKFIVLDELTTIKGFCKADGSFYYSNEVRSTTKDVLSVKTKKGLKASGVWSDIKGQLTGSDFCKSVYVLFMDGSEPKVGNVSIMKSAIAGWFDFCKANVLSKSWVVINTALDQKTGSISFKAPKYESLPASEKEIAQAKALDAQLQEFLKAYLSANNTSTEHDDMSDEERDLKSQSENI